MCHSCNGRCDAGKTTTSRVLFEREYWYYTKSWALSSHPIVFSEEKSGVLELVSFLHPILKEETQQKLSKEEVAKRKRQRAHFQRGIKRYACGRLPVRPDKGLRFVWLPKVSGNSSERLSARQKVSASQLRFSWVRSASYEAMVMALA